MTKKKPLKFGQTLFGAYKEVLKHTFPGIITLVVLNLLFPSLFTYLFSVFLFGMLYINCAATLGGDTTLMTKELCLVVAKRYFPALGLTLTVVGLCIFAFFGPAAPLGILPNAWLGFLFYFLIFDLFLFAVLTGLFVIVSVYLAYSLLFFWLDQKPLLESLKHSYELVKGQWRRAALYVFLSNVLPAIVFLGIPSFIFCLIGISAGVSATDVMHANVTGLLLFVLTAAVVFPLQTLLNISYFQQLKNRA